MALEKFHYTTKAGTEVILPKFDTISIGVIRRTRNLDGQDQMFTILEVLLGDDSPEMAALDAMPTGELTDFVKAWQKDAGITVGESSPS